MLESIDVLISFVLIILVVSLLITVAVQMVSGLLNLRGRNLARSLTETLKVACPELENDADSLVHHVLQAPLLSDAALRLDWLHKIHLGFLHSRLATAARPNEVFDAIHRIATAGPTETGLTAAEIASLKTSASSLLTALGIPVDDVEGAVAAAAGAANNLDASAQAIVDQLPAEQQAAVQNAFSAYSLRLKTYTSRAASGAMAEVKAGASDIDQAYAKFQYWYSIGQDRAQSWFTTHAHMVTFVFAVFFALLFQLDTVEIFKLVSTSKDVRDALVAQASTVTAEAQKIIGSSPDIEAAAVTKFAEGEPADKQADLNALQIAPTDTREKVRAKVATVLGTQDASDLGKFDRVLDDTAKDRVTQGSHDFRALSSSLDDTGFNLFPHNGRWRWGTCWYTGFGQHWFGVLCSVALLSLGAPFWFNALASLTNLRSALADNICEEQATGQSGQGQSTGPKPLATMAAD